MRRRAEIVLAIAMLCIASAVLTPVAGAAYSQIGTFAGGGSGFGGSGSADGQLSDPGGASVSDVTGAVYVVDQGNNRIQVFEPVASGARYGFTAKAAPEGAVDVAVDRDVDDVFVAVGVATFGERVLKFDAQFSSNVSGWNPPLFTGAIAVDPSNGDLLVADQGANLIRRFDSDGTPAGSFAAERPLDVAVDSAGEIFVVTSTGDLFTCATSAVQRFSASGDPEGAIGAGLVAPSAVAVDPDDDSILVAAGTNGYNCGGPEPEVAVFDADGSPRQSLALADSQYATVSGLAVQGGGSGRAYVVTKSPAGDQFGKTRAIALEDDTPAAPLVVGQSASPGENDAELQAAVNPRHAGTSYYFEFGPTASYGTTTPSGTIPAGREELTVQAVVGGLQPDTTYHYRVVAENAVDTVAGPDRTFRTLAASTGADTCPNAAIRAEQATAFLGECRAYEMVSPVDKNRGSVLWGAAGAPIVALNGSTADGERLAFNSYPPLGGSGHGHPSTYRATRGPAGWQSETMAPQPPGEYVDTLMQTAFAMDATDDFSKLIYETRGQFDPLDQDTLEFPGFRVTFPDVYVQADGEPLEWISRGDVDAPDAEFKEAAYVGRSDDASTVYFESTESLTPEAAPMAEGANYLYARGPGGTRLINTDENGQLLGECGASMGSYLNTNTEGTTTRNAVSPDGTRAFFQVPDREGRFSFDPRCNAPTAIYMRDGDTVKNVSASQMTAPEPVVSDATYQGASADGSRVFFVSADRLTDDATPGGGLYAYDVDSEALRFLSTGASGPEGAQVKGVVKLSDDGTHAYFLAAGQLVPGEGEAGAANLYLWSNGAVRFVATLTKGDAQTMYVVEAGRPARITPDGSSIIFVSRADQTAYEAEGTAQVYLWSEKTGATLCASCDPAGNPPDGDAALVTFAGFFFKPNPENHDTRNISSDGSRVFFESVDGLVKADVNGALDVYVYSPGGVPRLVSDGKAKFGSAFFDASADGRDAYFATQASLIPQDVDNGENDVYDARIGGGFAAANAAPACEGEACQGPPTSARQATGVASAGLSAPQAKNRRAARPLGPVSARPRDRSVTVAVRVGGAGRLSVSGPGLRPAKKSVRSAGTQVLKLSLRPGARARLRAKGSLSVRIAVRFAAADGGSYRRSKVVEFRVAAKCTKKDKCKNADRGARK